MFFGDCPYDLVSKKFDGSKDSPNLSIELGNPNPTFLNVGINNSSFLPASPLPNSIVVVPFELDTALNLLGVFINLRIDGTVFLN